MKLVLTILSPQPKSIDATIFTTAILADCIGMNGLRTFQPLVKIVFI
jgi:hypothetical protein